MTSASQGWPATRARLLRITRLLNWIVLLGIVVSVAVIRPETTNAPTNLVAGAIIFVLALVSTRIRSRFAGEASRQAAELGIFLCAYTVLLWIVEPAGNALSAYFAVVVVVARLILPRSIAIGVVVLACLLSSLLHLASALSLINIASASAYIIVFIALYYIADVLRSGALAVDQRMRHASGRDALTGLPHRMSFIGVAEKLQAVAVERRSAHAVLVVDINNLKSINERYGYEAGDRAVTLVARAVERLIEKTELLGRYDGGKFVVLSPVAQKNRCEELASRIRSAIFSTTVDVDSDVVRIRANVGTARFPIAGVTLSALMTAAENDALLDREGRDPPKTKPVFRRRSGKMSA